MVNKCQGWYSNKLTLWTIFATIVQSDITIRFLQHAITNLSTKYAIRLLEDLWIENEVAPVHIQSHAWYGTRPVHRIGFDTGYLDD